MKRKSIIVGGIGNPLMTDEGIGIHLIAELTARPDIPPNVDCIDLGSSLMNVVHAIAGREKAILIDCARMEEPPGTIRRFTPQDVSSQKALPHFSLHEGDLMDGLELSRRLGEYPQQVVIFGIQPASMEEGEALSPSLQKQLGSYIEAILREITGGSA
ncbi:MAG: hydrogenase maturation protease [Dehalococcoidia bacterium]|nr:hydrogenase maturation protease [Dehalococcoidia bacterium]